MLSYFLSLSLSLSLSVLLPSTLLYYNRLVTVSLSVFCSTILLSFFFVLLLPKFFFVSLSTRNQLKNNEKNSHISNFCFPQFSNATRHARKRKRPTA